MNADVITECRQLLNDARAEGRRADEVLTRARRLVRVGFCITVAMVVLNLIILWLPR